MRPQEEQLPSRSLPVDLHETGLLWLINRTVFHPRSFSLGVMYADGQMFGFVLDGDGSEPHSFPAEDELGLFAAVEQAFAEARRRAVTP